MAKPTGEPGWTWRRALCIILVAYACYQLGQMVNAPDTRVNDTIAWVWGVVIIAMGMSFFGFATAQDIAAIMATKSGLPYSPVSSPAEPTPGTAAVAVAVEADTVRPG